mgnify:FL=1
MWIKRYDNGDISFWTLPDSSRGDLLAEIVRGRAA